MPFRNIKVSRKNKKLGVINQYEYEPPKILCKTCGKNQVVYSNTSCEECNMKSNLRQFIQHLTEVLNEQPEEADLVIKFPKTIHYLKIFKKSTDEIN